MVIPLVQPAELLENTTLSTMHTCAQNATYGLNQSAATLLVNIATADQKNQMKNPNPDCQLDCRFHDLGSMTTCMYFPPVFDKHGNNVNPDGNTTTSSVRCSVCDKTWTSTTKYGETTFKEVR